MILVSLALFALLREADLKAFLAKHAKFAKKGLKERVKPKNGFLRKRNDKFYFVKEQWMAMSRENELAEIVVDTAFKIHRTLGPGLLESAYEAILVHELQKRGLIVAAQVPVPVTYESVRLDAGFRADLIVENSVIVELKSLEKIAPVHKKQLATYLKLADKRLTFPRLANHKKVSDSVLLG